MFPGDPQRRQTVSAIPILSQANAAPGLAVVAINGRTGTVTNQRDSMGIVVQMDDGTTERMNAFTTFHLQSDVVPFLQTPPQSSAQQTPPASSTPPAATIQPTPRNAAEAAQLREEQAQAQLPGVMEGFGAGARHGTALRVEQSPITISSPQAVQIVLQNPNDYEFTTNQDGAVVISGAFDPVDNVWRGKPKTKPQPTRIVPSQVVVGDTIQLGGSPRLVTSVFTDKGTTTIVATNPETGAQQTLSGSDKMLEVEVVSRAQAPQPPTQQPTTPILAPNGKPSNLKPEEQQLAKSPEFKAWFGNWQPMAILQGKPLVSVSTDAVPIINSRIIDSAVAWIISNPQPDAKTEIGDVRIGQDDIRTSFSHSNYPNKLAVLPALRDILERGAYLGNAPDWKRQNTTDHYFAAPVEINGANKQVFVRVISEKGNPNRLHVHEIFTQDEIDKAGHIAPSEILPPNRGMQTPPSAGNSGTASDLFER